MIFSGVLLCFEAACIAASFFLMEPPMDLASTYFAKEALRAFLLPPGIFAFVLLAGILFWRSRLGKGLAIISALFIYVLATPLAAGWLMAQVESLPLASSTPLGQVDAIVCLGGGKRFGAIDLPGNETINNVTLARLRQAARLHRQTGKPILVSGGAPAGGIPEANLMRDTLEQDFRVPVRWVENQSSDTRDNAAMSAALLPPGQRDILLVTSANHMARARQAFEAAGFKVVAAPTDYTNREPLTVLSGLPRPAAFYSSSIALRELAGSLWYRWRE